jgi:hypothetical protein
MGKDAEKGSAGMRVLIGCATSCVALDAFLARGHDAWQCDLLPAEILATYDKQARAARKTTPGGVLLRPDLLGVWKRVAALHDTTVEHVRELVEGRHG